MSNKWKNLIDIWARVFILVVIIAVLAIIKTDAFWTVDNLKQVVLQQAPFTILMSFGMSMAIISKGIDISMASVMVLSSYLSASSFQAGNYLLGVIIAMAVGLFFGAANGVLITKAKIEPFIATYCVDFIAIGLAYIICQGKYIYGFPDSFRKLTNGSILGVPVHAVIMLIIFAILYFLTRKTIFGRGFYSIGNNPVAAKLSGIKVDMTVILIYMINGLIAALVGILFLSRLNAADPSIKGTLTMDSMASALIGGIVFGGGKGSVFNAVIGSLIIIFIRNGMNIMNISTNWQQAVVGFVILFSIFYEQFVKNVIKKFTNKKNESATDKVQSIKITNEI